MRGNPLLRTAVMAVLLLFLAWPVWNVTTRAGTPVATLTQPSTTSPKMTANASGMVSIEADFLPAAQQFTLKYLGRTLVSVDHPGTHWQGEVTLDGESGTRELVVEAGWAEGTGSSALRLRLKSGDKPGVEKTFWSDGHLLEVVQVN